MAKKRIEISYLDYANSYWIHEESLAGIYEGEEYYEAPRTIGYADTLSEAEIIATEARRRIYG